MVSLTLLFLSWLSFTPPSPADALALTGTLEKQVYCEDGPELEVLRLHLHLQLTNRGPAPVLVHRAAGDLVGLRIAATKEDLAGGKLVSRFDVSPSTVWSNVTAGDFVTLGPAESLAIEAMAPIPLLKNEGDATIKGPRLGTGDRVLSVALSLWQGEEADAAQWRTRLESRGTLMLNAPWSLPIAFTVDPAHRAVACPD